jgi:hypothetical protein
LEPKETYFFQSKIQNCFPCGAIVRAFHPASPFASLLEKAKPRAFWIEKELGFQIASSSKNRERQVITLQKKMSKLRQIADFLKTGSVL